MLFTSDDWEIDCRQLKLSGHIGQGAFGKVVTGYYNDQRVAVKLVRGKSGSASVDTNHFLDHCNLYVFHDISKFESEVLFLSYLENSEPQVQDYFQLAVPFKVLVEILSHIL